MARYALERIPAPEAAQAMRDALPQLSGKLKVGVIGSLGVRQDAASVPALAALLGDADPAVALRSGLRPGRHPYTGSDPGPGESQVEPGGSPSRHHGRLSGMCRTAVGGRQEGRSAGGVPKVHRR